MAKHAGFALTQGLNFSRIDYWNCWKPFDEQTEWLLLSGSSDPPKTVQVSERRPRGEAKSKDGPFLYGMSRDFTSMTDALIRNGLELFSTLNKLRITKKDAKEEIKDLFYECRAKGKRAVIYYTGHGEIGTGNWCFRDGTMSIKEIEDLIPQNCLHPFIICDCCYSGHWADYCLKKGVAGFHCLAACPYFSTAVDIDAKGGQLTCYVTDQINENELTRTPVCSTNDDENCPFDKKTETFYEMFTAHLKNKNRIVKCHTIANGKISAIFTEKDSWIETNWTYSSNFEAFREQFDHITKKGYICSSFACDNNNFLTFFKEGRASQICFSGNEDVVRRIISIAWRKNFKITACGAHYPSWTVIMTTSIPGRDIFPIRSSWFDCLKYMDKVQYQGYRLKGLCYNMELQKYFIYMRNTPKRGKAKRFAEGQLKKARKWLRKNMNEFQVDIIFKDPTNNQTYVALEETDSPHHDIDLAFDFREI